MIFFYYTDFRERCKIKRDFGPAGFQNLGSIRTVRSFPFLEIYNLVPQFSVAFTKTFCSKVRIFFIFSSYPLSSNDVSHKQCGTHNTKTHRRIVIVLKIVFWDEWKPRPIKLATSVHGVCIVIVLVNLFLPWRYTDLTWMKDVHTRLKCNLVNFEIPTFYTMELILGYQHLEDYISNGVYILHSSEICVASG